MIFIWVLSSHIAKCINYGKDKKQLPAAVVKERQLGGKEGEVVCQELGKIQLEADPEGRVKYNKRTIGDKEFFWIKKMDFICSPPVHN